MMSLSRRSWLTLTACACASVSDALSADAFAADELPPGYTSPFHVPESGKAPGMRVLQMTVTPSAPRSWIIVFADGDEVMSGLTDWVRLEKIAGAHLSALGAFSSAKFAWFDKDKRAYRDIPVNEQVECVSLTGDVGLVNGHPALHVHGCVAREDGSIRGGHLLEATVFPTLELFLTESQAPLVKNSIPRPISNSSTYRLERPDRQSALGRLIRFNQHESFRYEPKRPHRHSPDHGSTGR
jgi:uncharacterized protein